VEFLTQIGLPLVVITIMIFGLSSLVLMPILPGLVIIWVGPALFALLNGFSGPASIILFVAITLLMIAGNLVDNLLMGASARRTGASWVTITLAMVAGFVGSFFLPIFGGILVSLLALFAFELIRQHDLRVAFASTKGMALGCGWAVVARFSIGLVMIALYLAWLFWARS